MENESKVADSDVQQVVSGIRIPACPAVLTKLIRVMRGDDPNFGEIARLIGTDVGLSAAMLKTVNSAFYGLRTKATSVSQAVALLGLSNVERLVKGLLVREAFSGGVSRTMEEFWESSSKIALITAWLARKVKVANHEDAYTFSLFRDCGIAAMIANRTEYEPAVYSDPELMLAAEKKQFGIDHPTLGYRMAKHWLLPDTACAAVLYHHEYDRLINREIDIPKSSVKLIVLALASERIFTMDVEATQCQGWDKAGEFVLKQLHVTASQLEDFISEIDEVLAT